MTASSSLPLQVKCTFTDHCQDSFTERSGILNHWEEHTQAIAEDPRFEAVFNKYLAMINSSDKETQQGFFALLGIDEAEKNSLNEYNFSDAEKLKCIWSIFFSG